MDAFLFTLTLFLRSRSLFAELAGAQDREDRLIPPASVLFSFQIPTQRPVPIICTRASRKFDHLSTSTYTADTDKCLRIQHTLPPGFLPFLLGFPRKLSLFQPFRIHPDSDMNDPITCAPCFAFLRLRYTCELFPPPLQSSCVCPPVHHPFRL